MAKHFRASPLARKISLFYSIIITIILSYAIIRISLLLLYSNFHKKRAFDFLKRKFCTNVCLKLRCDPKLITPFLIFQFLLTASEVETSFPYSYILELPTFEYGCLVGLNIKERTRQRQRALMSNHCLISHRWYNGGKLTVPGSSNLKVEHKVLC